MRNTNGRLLAKPAVILSLEKRLGLIVDSCIGCGSTDTRNAIVPTGCGTFTDCAGKLNFWDEKYFV